MIFILQMWICFTMFIALVVTLFILSSLAVRLWSAGSVIVVHGFICPTSCGNLLDQGSKQCPLHCTEDSQPLDYPESPRNEHFNQCFNIYLLYDVYIWTKTTRNDLFKKLQVKCMVFITMAWWFHILAMWNWIPPFPSHLVLLFLFLSSSWSREV